MGPVLTPALKPLIAAQKWLILPLLLFAVSVTLQARGTYQVMNNWLLDLRMDSVPLAPTGEIGVIAIDPQSLDEIGTWPWSRAVHAEILDRLVDLGAGVVFFDVDFAFADDVAGDAAFTAALERAGGATLLANFPQHDLRGATVFNQPHLPFRGQSWPAVVSVHPDANGQIRDYPTGAMIDGSFIPSAGVQLAGSYASSSDSFTINYGLSPQDIPVFSVSDLLDGTLTQADIAGRSILIGAAALELGDHFAVPLHQVIPGVMIHALAAETLLQGVAVLSVPALWLLPALLVLLCALQVVGQQSAWRLVSLAFLAGFSVEALAFISYWTDFYSLPTVMVHPALIVLAIIRLASNVDFSRILIKRQEVQMANAERLRQHIFANSSDGFVAINGQGAVVFQSDVARALFGNDAVPPAVLDIARQVTADADSGPRLDHLDLETGADTKSLELFANASVLDRLDNDLNRASEPLALITLRDVTDLKRKQRQIEYLSRHDDRTSALRRHSFATVVESCLVEDRKFAVAAIALKRLTAINATLGREVGDQIIVEAVRRLQDPALGLGEIARLEGNILGVLIPRAADDTAMEATCRRMRDVLTQPYHLGDSQIPIDLHIGYVTRQVAQDWDGEGYLSRAQDALANAADHTTGGCSAYDGAENERRERARRIEHALNQALERGEFHLLYQPQYRLSDRALIGAEALIRWDSAEFGFVSPVEFIPIAESSGFIRDLGQFVLDQSIAAATALPDHLTMSPNVSTFQLLSPDFPDQVATALERTGLAPGRLCLELTESEFLSPDSEAVQRMQAIRAMGVTWALDDFGTGYSSLSYLKELPFEKIKLDRSFLKDILVDHKAQTTVRSLVQLVQGYGKTLLCEGTETEDEVALLTDYGCDSVQGYYFGRPEPLKDLQARAAAEVNEAQIPRAS